MRKTINDNWLQLNRPDGLLEAVQNGVPFEADEALEPVKVAGGFG